MASVFFAGLGVGRRKKPVFAEDLGELSPAWPLGGPIKKALDLCLLSLKDLRRQAEKSTSSANSASADPIENHATSFMGPC